MSGVPYAATLVTAVGCGLAAGVFFAFSTFVMPALERVTPSGGVEAMQSINRVALTPPFMIALFGTALVALGLIVWSVVSSDDRPTAMIVAGGGLYLVGTIGVTIAGNVPLNDRLERADSAQATSTGWHDWVSRWTAWNHVRTAAALAAAALLTLALDG
jgi:uncharacterized membrane protein